MRWAPGVGFVSSAQRTGLRSQLADAQAKYTALKLDAEQLEKHIRVAQATVRVRQILEQVGCVLAAVCRVLTCCDYL